MKRTFILILMLVTLLVPTVSHASSDNLTRITFAPGATSWFIGERAIGANLLEEYVLKANQGQYMVVGVTEYPDTNMNLTIIGAKDGVVLVNASTSNYWAGYLPSTQDYIMRVSNIGAATKYALSVSIPARIKFAAGGTAITLNGSVSLTQYPEYILGARKGQTMTVTVSPNNGTVGLTIYGIDGQPLKRSAGGDATWSGVLPVTQDYIIVLTALPNTSTNFSIYISIV